MSDDLPRGWLNANPSHILTELLSDDDVKSSPLVEQRLKELRRATYGSKGEDNVGAFLATISRVLFENRLFASLGRLPIPRPVYNYLEDLSENEREPWSQPLPTRPVVEGKSWTLFGRPIGLPIGVPASPLTVNSSWVAWHARNGFNVLTYKTVRTRARDPLRPKPNWVFLEGLSAPLNDQTKNTTTAWGNVDTYPADPATFSTANSFGVPSKDPHIWLDDVRTALSRLSDDQVLLLSVMGTFEDLTGDALVADFVEAARLGASTGVDAIELNLSCPNGFANGKPLPPIFQSPDTVERIVMAVRESIDPRISIVVKLGYLASNELLAVLTPISDVIDGVSGINTVPMSVRQTSDQSSAPAFPGRSVAGVSGMAIRDLALDFVRSCSRARRELGASFDIIGMGGVMVPADCVEMYNAGASVVQSASAAFFNPYLVQQVVESIGLDFPCRESGDMANLELVKDAVREDLRDNSASSLGQIVARTKFGPSAVRLALDDMENQLLQIDHGLDDPEIVFELR
jgi:dihydroorotate dehydrogenase